MTDVQELHKRFHDAVEQWIPVRDSSIQEIQKTVDKLREHHKNVNISRIAGSTASIAGGTMAIIGFAIAPLTFGASIGLSVSGIALAVAGGTTAAGASIADVVIQKSNVKYAQKQLDHDYELLDEICDLANKINETIKMTKDKCPEITLGEFAVVFGEVLGQGAVRTGNMGLKIPELAVLGTLEIGATALRFGSAAARGIATAGIVLNVVLIPIDLIEIVRSSVSLAKGSQTRAITRLTEVEKELEKQKESIKAQAGII